MTKFAFIDGRDGDTFVDVYENKGHALYEAKYQWRHLTDREKDNRDEFKVVSFDDDPLEYNEVIEDYLNPGYESDIWELLINGYYDAAELCEIATSYCDYDRIVKLLASEIASKISGFYKPSRDWELLDRAAEYEKDKADSNY